MSFSCHKSFWDWYYSNHPVHQWARETERGFSKPCLSHTQQVVRRGSWVWQSDQELCFYSSLRLQPRSEILPHMPKSQGLTELSARTGSFPSGTQRGVPEQPSVSPSVHGNEVSPSHPTWGVWGSVGKSALKPTKHRKNLNHSPNTHSTKRNEKESFNAGYRSVFQLLSE